MKKLGCCIVGLLIYFLGGWVIRGIVFSTIDPETSTFGDVFSIEIATYCIITGILCFVLRAIASHDFSNAPEWPLYTAGFLLLTSWATAKFQWLPYSLHLIILFNIICIGSILLCVIVDND